MENRRLSSQPRREGDWKELRWCSYVHQAPKVYKHLVECLGGKRTRVIAFIYPMIERFPGHREERVIIVGRPGCHNEGKIYHDISYNLYLKLVRMDFFELDDSEDN